MFVLQLSQLSSFRLCGIITNNPPGKVLKNIRLEVQERNRTKISIVGFLGLRRNNNWNQKITLTGIGPKI